MSQNIVAGRNRLSKAVHRMIDARPGLAGTKTAYQPSLYDTLVGDLAGTQGETRTPAKSMPPCWIDAVQLRADIDTTVRRWKPGQQGSTSNRLRILAEQPWRPDDTVHVLAIAKTVESWCESIAHLIDPEHVKHVSAPCPTCGTATVWRTDTAGERVRTPALKLVTESGCTCQACGAHWEPTKYLFLVRLLGWELPDGVLE